MTASEFKRTIYSKEKFDIYFTYAFSLLIILVSLFLFYKRVVDVDYNIVPVLVPVLLFMFGIYGIWRKFKDLDVMVIPCDSTVEEKKATVVKYLKKLNVKERLFHDNFYQVRYMTRYWHPVCLYIYFNSESYYINVKGSKKFLARDKVDIGLVQRAALRIENYLKAS